MTDRQLEAFLQLFDDRIQDIVDEYLQKMGRHIKDIGKLIPSDINRLIELKRMNANMAVIKRKIARAAERMERDLETVYAEAAKSDYRFQAEILNAQPPKDISENINLQRMILAQAQLTGETMRNIAQTTIVSEGYQQAIDRGIETVLSGIVDYRTAVRRAVKEAAYEGLKLKYPSGYRMRLDSAVRMNVLDGVRAVSQMARDQAGKDFDADGVEISAHNLCAKDHLPYQGKQYANAEFDEIQRELPRPFGRWNCRHIWWHIRIGITHPTYTAEQLEQFEKNSNESIAIDNKAMSRYQWTQEQRRIETAIRREKDAGIAAKANGDDKAVRDSKRNVKALMEYYQKISDEAGLTPKWERIYVDKEAVLRSRQKTEAQGFSSVKANLKSVATASPSFLNKGDRLYKNAQNIKPIEGYEDIVVHADKYSFVFKDADGMESNVPVAEFSKILKQSDVYHGGAIRLIACESAAEGAITAQALSDSLGVEILAPNDIVYVHPDGSMTVGHPLTNTGEWVKIKPRKNG